MTLTTMVSIGMFLEAIAKAHVERAQDEKQHDGSHENKVSHTGLTNFFGFD